MLAKVPAHAQDEVKAASWQVFDDLEPPPGQQAVAEAQRRVQAFADRYQRFYPAAVACRYTPCRSSPAISGSQPSTGRGSATPT